MMNNCFHKYLLHPFHDLEKREITFIPGRGSAPVGAWKPPEIHRFHLSRGRLSPYSPHSPPPWLRICIEHVTFRIGFDKVLMQGKLFQRCTQFLYCSVLSSGGKVNTRRMSQPDMESIFTKIIYEIFWS